jgi:hypothetical protein
MLVFKNYVQSEGFRSQFRRLGWRHRYGDLFSGSQSVTRLLWFAVNVDVVVLDEPLNLIARQL